MYTYIYEQLGKRSITTRDGARNNYDEQRATNSEQGGGQMPISVRFDAENRKQVEGAAGRTRTVLETALS